MSNQTDWNLQSSFGLVGKRAIVTGASRGIGRALAVGFAAAGADLVLMGRDAGLLAETAEDAKNLRQDVNVDCVLCDLRDVEQVEECVQSIVSSGPVDVLVNNAGMNIRTPAVEVSEEQWRTVVDTDLKGAFFMAQQVGKRMLERGQGSIVNVASVGGLVALRTGVAYAAAKAGVVQMTKVLALEWSGRGVRVNCIAPWYFRTPLTEKLLNDPQYLAEIVSRTPMRRVGDLHELIGPAVFLASDAASYVTGQTLAVDGGMTIYGF